MTAAQAIAMDDGTDSPVLSASDILILPNARAAVLQQTQEADGSPLLTLYVRDKEISWEDPRHFPFAEGIASGAEFSAAEASQWGELGWDEAAQMLDALLEEGLIVRAEDAPVVADRHDNKPMPSLLPPAPMATPRTWMDADSLMAELTGTALDSHWLEVVVPVFRTAHIFMDRDGRHVGEANAFPAAARTEVPTEWRGCPYAGNRYQPDRPMNMTALKAMRAHWRQMMGLILPIREAYLRRFPEARKGWTVAHVERLTVCILALPSYLLLNHADPVRNGDLHPALSNLFRVTDGLRMVMHHMLFVPLFETMQQPDAPVSAETILTYADRNFLFHSAHGVCAGPRFMVEDVIGVLLHGASPRSGFDAEMDPELQAAASLIEPAMDYGLLGLQAFGSTFSLWPAMARCYDRLNALLASEAGAGVPEATAMAARFAGHFEALSTQSFLASEEWRSHREAVYDDMFAACSKGIAGQLPDERLSALIAGGPRRIADDSRKALVAAASAHFGHAGSALAEGFAEIVLDFLLKAQRIIGLAELIQGQTGRLLNRPAPLRALTLDDINLHNALTGEDQRSVPFLPKELRQLLGLNIHVDASAIRIEPAA